jgi:hypothetical protein
MVELIAPNGVLVRASDADAPRMLAAGYRPIEQPKPEPKPAPKRRTTRRKPAKGE